MTSLIFIKSELERKNEYSFRIARIIRKIYIRK